MDEKSNPDMKNLSEVPTQSGGVGVSECYESDCVSPQAGVPTSAEQPGGDTDSETESLECPVKAVDGSTCVMHGAKHAKRDWTPGRHQCTKQWGQRHSFPRDAVALDSWATHYLIHPDSF